MSKWERMNTYNMSAPFKDREAWVREPSPKGAIYKVGKMYYLYSWEFLKGHKYKYLKEAQAVMDALDRLGELDGDKSVLEARFGFHAEDEILN